MFMSINFRLLTTNENYLTTKIKQITVYSLAKSSEVDLLKGYKTSCSKYVAYKLKEMSLRKTPTCIPYSLNWEQLILNWEYEELGEYFWKKEDTHEQEDSNSAEKAPHTAEQLCRNIIICTLYESCMPGPFQQRATKHKRLICNMCELTS